MPSASPSEPGLWGGASGRPAQVPMHQTKSRNQWFKTISAPLNSKPLTKPGFIGQNVHERNQELGGSIAGPLHEVGEANAGNLKRQTAAANLIGPAVQSKRRRRGSPRR